ncbi:DUF4339 domain-containing protein [Pedobacter sp. Leaf250]|uniref:DUF4339 domain-containing protein n=1 Tax=Pedobacter sp. Leaf250 TaxID=2876559 RepID=UPI001E62A536|nr:DUF4339 domain-containing protein [Pedobacter sp. Leaf250]
MNYYYLVGLERRGPLSLEEIKRESLSIDTLVWTEGMSQWKAVEDVPDLQASLPPPIPNELIHDLNSKLSQIKALKIFCLYFLPFIVASLGFYYKLSIDKQYYKDNLNERIANLMDGKMKVASATFTEPKVVSTKILIPKKKLRIKRNKAGQSSLDLLQQFSYKELNPKDEYRLSSGGFSIKELSRQDDGYELKTTSSGNLVFKPITSPFLSKPTAAGAYQHAYEYLLAETKDSFDSYKYAYLQNFEHLRNSLYSLVNLPNSLTLRSGSFSNSMIYNATYEVSIDIEKKFYKVQIIEEKYNDLIIKYIIIALITSLSISTTILVINPSNMFR